MAGALSAPPRTASLVLFSKIPYLDLQNLRKMELTRLYYNLFPVRCSYEFARCSYAARTLFVRARTHPRTTRRAPLRERRPSGTHIHTPYSPPILFFARARPPQRRFNATRVTGSNQISLRNVASSLLSNLRPPRIQVVNHTIRDEQPNRR